MNWYIGNVEIRNKLVLAPMAGTSNPAYMQICEEMGAGYVVTELLSAEAISRNNPKTLEMLKGIENLNIPVAVQIFGSSPESMVRAAQILEKEYNVKILDINMGCPVPKVALRAQAGSALLKNPEKIKELVSKVVAGVNIPVTVKIRSGWDKDSINAVEVAKVVESAGAKAITIHARTRAQGYSGSADWNVIKAVKENVKIPVIGNGDVTSPFLAEKMLKETGCDAVMIGRAALGNPWIFKESNVYLENKKIIPKPTSQEIITMIKKHYELLKLYKNEKVALLEIRTHAMYYLKGLKDAKVYKEKICHTKTEEEFFSILDNYQSFLM